ncbi:hypothetical protein BPIT_35390 [Candidatus Brocadia pituitae]|nr:hypothetical protein BPIT_35390 [Candidatus Brocadia pituitae]
MENSHFMSILSIAELAVANASSIALARFAVNGDRISENNVPLPGGTGAGVFFKPSVLGTNVTENIFYTKIITHPSGNLFYNGIGTQTNWLIYRTACNQTAHSLEVLNCYMYNHPEWIGMPAINSACIWDGWNGGFKIAKDLSSPLMQQYLHTEDDGGGHPQAVIYFALRTIKQGNQVNNIVYLWNFNANPQHWDIPYTSTYTGSADRSDPAWYIVETYKYDNTNHWVSPSRTEDHPDIKELGYKNGIFYHKGTLDYLTASSTTWPAPYWD